MSEMGGVGRARGRARGRPPTHGGEEEEGSSSPTDSRSDSPGSGNGDSAATGGIRGRGGFRPMTEVKTIPEGIVQTHGQGGANVRLFANYFKVRTPPERPIYDYRVDFNPEVENMFIRGAMLYDACKNDFQNAYIFDRQHNLKSLSRLPGDEKVYTALRRTDQTEVKIHVKLTGEIKWDSQEMLRLYNIQMRRNLQHMKYVQTGRHYYDNTSVMKLPDHKIDIWPGLITAVGQHDGGIMMVCDSTFKVVRADTAIDVMREVRQRDASQFQDNARRELAGSIVLTRYNNRTYKIDDIIFNKNPETMVFDRRGESINLIRYYQEQHNVTIRDSRQPLIQVLPSERDKRAGKTEPIILVPELCVMTGLTESMRANNELKKQMTQMTQAVPHVRVQNLRTFMSKLRDNAKIKEEMNQWEIGLDPELVKVTGRMLEPGPIYMAGDTDQSATRYQQRSGDFSKEIRSKKMRVTPEDLKRWIVICSPRDKGLVDDFTQTLNRVCGPMGMILSKPRIQVLDNDRTAAFVEACRNVPDAAQLVVIIVPNNNKDRYDSIKKIFCCDKPIPSQVIVARTIMKKPMLMSVCTKVGIQIGAKIGAEPWVLHIPPKKLMVVGYDTHHDGTRRNASVGGFVCTLNQALSRYYSRVAYHNSHEEMSNNLTNNFALGLKAFQEANGDFPERIVIYRDGVSEGQFLHVWQYERPQIKSAIEQTCGTKDIAFSFIIVTKRINTRFFEVRDGGKIENPGPGTVVDTAVTRKLAYDFFLVSQSVRQGTVAPTNYNIIVDTTGWRANHHQALAFKLCHLYYNWMGTIRVPAPCQYAHKIAFLTGTALHREPNPKLANKLFYL